MQPSAAEAHGMSRSGFYRAARAGRLTRLGRGVYLPADSPAADWDWIEAATRRPKATICLVSALAHHDLTDEIPSVLDVAIPRGMRPPVGNSALAWHQFDRASFGVGREKIPIPGTQELIGIYSPERSIIDAYRLRGAVGYELAKDALKEWLRRGGKPAHLIGLADQIPRAKAPVLHALETLT